MSLRRLATSVRSALRGTAGPVPVVSVVVEQLPDPSAATALAESLAGLRAVSARPVGTLTEVDTEFVCFAGTDDVFTPDGLAALLAGIRRGVVAFGTHQVRRGSQLDYRPPAGSTADLDLAGKLFRRDWLPEAEDQLTLLAMLAPRLVRLDPSQRVVVDVVVSQTIERDLHLPIAEQRRFDPDRLAARVAGVLAATDPPGAVDLDELRRLGTQWVRDSIGAGPAFADRLAPLAERGLLPQLRPSVDETGEALLALERHPRRDALAELARSAEIRESLVVFESFHGRAISDNPAAIAREFAERGLGLDLVWVVDDDALRPPPGTRAVRRGSDEWGTVMGQAHAFVQNAAAPPWFAKKPGQIHVQTWHGTPLKRIGTDRGPGDYNTWRHRRMVARQAQDWDLLLSPSRYCSEIFPRAFGFPGAPVELGQARNDVLVRPTGLREATRAELGIGEQQMVLLYAPTWREYLGVRDAKPLFLDAEQVVAARQDVVVLVRGHYNASKSDDVYVGSDRIIDVTRFGDIAPLYLAADVLVTDYSSVMFDFALTDKPIVLLTPDLAQYRDVERGFYFDLEATAPGPMVTDTDSVLQVLDSPDRYRDARGAFRSRYCPCDDGGASARAVDAILARW